MRRLARGTARILFGAVLAAHPALLAGQAPGANAWTGCRPAAGVDAPALVRDALHALGADERGGPVLHLRMTEATVEDYQSDRAYPPFFLGFTSRETWYQPATGVLRSNGRITFPNGEYPVGEILSAPTATYLAGDTLRPDSLSHAAALVLRALDPWALVHDWAAAGNARVVGRCLVRDYPRLLLERNGPYGRERLALDPRTRLPVTLQREEPHYLWGQIAVEYIWSNWERTARGAVPASSFRLVDGKPDVSRTVAEIHDVAPDSAPSLAVPRDGLTMTPAPPLYLLPTPPDSVRVSAATRLLVNRGYREAAALLGDTLYLLDATQGERRARADSSLLAGMFPGDHPVVLVVTDLAWPHIAGLRYWAARGATIVSHRMSRPFIEQVLARRWTREPDLYEQRRGQAHLRFVPVNDSVALAGGRLRLYPIDGLGGEGGIVAYLPDAGFLWAGDYIQTAAQPTTYTSDVGHAVQRAGLKPSRVAAQHLPLTPWRTIDSLSSLPPPAAPN